MMTTIPRVSYMDESDRQYSVALSRVRSLRGLKLLLTEWRWITGDAAKVAAAMTAQDFKDFLKALFKERRGEYCGDAATERFGEILVPVPMLQVTLVAAQFHAPWGTAYIRLREEGYLDESSGQAVYKPRPPATGTPAASSGAAGGA